MRWLSSPAGAWVWRWWRRAGYRRVDRAGARFVRAGGDPWTITGDAVVFVRTARPDDWRALASLPLELGLALVGHWGPRAVADVAREWGITVPVDLQE